MRSTGSDAHGARSLGAHDLISQGAFIDLILTRLNLTAVAPVKAPHVPWYSSLRGRLPYVEGREGHRGNEVILGAARCSFVARARYPTRHRVRRQFSRALRPQPWTCTLRSNEVGDIDFLYGYNALTADRGKHGI
jgi:hypothetical protein